MYAYMDDSDSDLLLAELDWADPLHSALQLFQYPVTVDESPSYIPLVSPRSDQHPIQYRDQYTDNQHK